MAIAGPTLRSRFLEVGSCAAASCQPKIGRSKTFLTVTAILCSMSAAGCARDPPQHEFNSALNEVKASPVPATARTRQYSQLQYAGPRIHRPDPALLAPQPAPDCGFKRSNVNTVDPDEWVRLKIDYERQCYQNSEKVARDRLSLLQASLVRQQSAQK